MITIIPQEQWSSKITSKYNPFSLPARLKGLGRLSDLSCLDLGCGKNESPISATVLQIPWRVLTSVEVWPVNVQLLRLKHLGGEIAAKAWNVFMEPMENLLPRMVGEFDVILILDSLEHLTKGEALRFLRTVEGQKYRRLLIWLPLGPCPQGPREDNPHEVHLSTWSAEELDQLGYDVQVFPRLHRHITPWVDAAWATKNNPHNPTSPSPG